MARSVGRPTIRLLGPLEVAVRGRPVAVTSARQRTLVAVLALSANKTVSVQHLATAVWGNEPPSHVRRTLQTYVSRLRAMLGPNSIAFSPVGYELRAEPDDVDALRLVRLLDCAAQAADPVRERTLLDEALALWRGTPFEEMRSAWLHAWETPRLLDRYLTAVERRVDLAIVDGHGPEMLPQLRELTARHQLRESLWARLLRVLDLCGRPAEALERYEAIRIRISDELGVDPGPELRETYEHLLARTNSGPVSDDPAAGWRVVPRQLPVPIDGFAGRATELRLLHTVMDETDTGTARPMIATISGPAGVGKSTLAVHWAHEVTDRFPDGQLYLNLRGFDPSGQAMRPAEAVRGLLEAMQVPPAHVPTGLDAQTGLLRSLLAGKRVLMVLDNARDTDQVRPLLPGDAGCVAVVTSRSQLTGLAAATGALQVTLEPMTVDEARQLLMHRIGPTRVTAEPHVVDDIITVCDGLPLALALVAVRAAIRPDVPLDTLAAQLRDARHTLDALTSDNPETDLRAVYSWSYRLLPDAAARLFRLLCMHPGPDITPASAASLMALPVTQVMRPLTELSWTHMLMEHQPGRYHLHHLLRAYGTDLAHTHDSDLDRREAIRRTLDHYLHSACAAAQLLLPHRDPISPEPAVPGVNPESLDDYAQATAWFTAEHRVLVASVELADGAGFDTHAWQLAWTLVDFLDRRGHWHDWLTTQTLALTAAHRLKDRAEQARAHRGVARACTKIGRYDDARTHLEHALDLYGQLNDLTGQAATHLDIARGYERRRRYEHALHHTQLSLDLSVAADDLSGQANALNGIGWCHSLLGDNTQAFASCKQALTLHQQLGYRRGEGNTWDSLGYILHLQGHHEQAIACYRRALDLFEAIDDQHEQALTLERLGDTHHAAGQPEAARTEWLLALAILDRLGQPDAEAIRAKLAVPPD